jgi:hypothetical protein
MANLEDILLVPVAKEDFPKFNEFAEAMMIVKNPAIRSTQIKALRKLILRLFQEFQQERLWLSKLEEDIENNIYQPKLIRRHSI